MNPSYEFKNGYSVQPDTDPTRPMRKTLWIVKRNGQPIATFIYEMDAVAFASMDRSQLSTTKEART